MDAYPPEYVAHNGPLMVLSGLDVANGSADEFNFPGKGVTLSSRLPLVTGARAEHIGQEFLGADSSNAPWNARPNRSQNSLFGYRVRAVGRKFTLPARKAEPPATHPLGGSSELGQSQSWILHSPISPLSPGAPTYPDSLMTPLWIAKHQNYVPAVFIAFFSITSDPQLNSLNDNQLKGEINAIKSALQQSEYKTRFAVVLLSEKTILQAPEIEERLTAIKRVTGLDPRNSLFFLPPNTSRVEVAAFVNYVLSALHPLCIDYYRDLAKHARRKKNRGIIAPPTLPPTKGTSQTLSSHGWSIRYEYKQGIFAEFRKDMDTASRHYNTALDALLGPDGIFETTASWSVRWDESRLLSDTIALRSIRCLLWNEQCTTAVQTWIGYKNRMRDIIDRRGKGAASYGWEAWESRWAKIMAELIKRADLPLFSTLDSGKEGETPPAKQGIVFIQPEKPVLAADRIPAWHLAHHPGYWLRVSAEHAIMRRHQAELLPDEDRVEPKEAPKTQVARRPSTYDTYLVPEPHIEFPQNGARQFHHCDDIVETLEGSIIEFHARGQHRTVDWLRLKAGQELIHAGRFANAYNILKPLWEGMSWRKDCWWNLLSEATWALYESAVVLRDPQVILSTQWELLNELLPQRTGFDYGFMQCLDSLEGAPSSSGEKTIVSIDAANVTPCVTLSFVFAKGEEHVGELLASQVIISSVAHVGSAPITLSKASFTFSGSLGEITINHEGNPDIPPSKDSCIINCSVSEESVQKEKPVSRWLGSADLTLFPQQTKVISFPIILREAGEINIASTSLTVENDKFIFTSTSANTVPESPMWWTATSKGVRPKRFNRDGAPLSKILPKPPKMEILLSNFLGQYYTDEEITLDIDIINKEEESTEAVLEVRILGHSEDMLAFSWVKPDEDIGSVPKEPKLSSSDIGLPGHSVGQLSKDSRRTEHIKLKAPQRPGDFTVEVKVLYHILSDKETPISKNITAELVFADPFEATYELAPRVHLEPWPSFFDAGDEAISKGIIQSWVMKARLASLVNESIMIEDMEVVVDSVRSGEAPIVSKDFTLAEPLEVTTEDVQERAFSVISRKSNLEERRAQSVDLNYIVRWRRKGAASATIVTTLMVPTMTLPSGEPRVLAAAAVSSSVPSLIHMSYTLENPTLHFLTFELSMEASDEFAFSGPKLGSLNLVPLARHTVHFNLYPLVRGAWITPQLRVVDRYFNKTLKVLATDGLKLEKKGIMVWVDSDEGGP